MAITRHILDLIDLALQDRVLTYKERETIVATAAKEGVPEAEINAVLNNMLDQRLKSFTKEELKECPTCGHSVPLLSPRCLYCGHDLEQYATAAQRPPAYTPLSGEDADIIRAENLRVEQEDQSVKNCPDCGAPFPLMSNICQHCGHVLHTRQSSSFNIKNLIQNINNSIVAMRNAPRPTFGDVLSSSQSTLMLLSGIILFVIAFSYPTTIGGMMLVLGIFLGWRGVKSHTYFSPLVSSCDKVYYKALHDHNKYVRIVDSIYGDDKEAKDYLAQLGNELQAVEQIRRQNRSKLNLMIAGIILAAVLLLAVRPSAKTFFAEHIDPAFSIFNTK